MVIRGEETSDGATPRFFLQRLETVLKIASEQAAAKQTVLVWLNCKKPAVQETFVRRLLQRFGAIRHESDVRSFAQQMKRRN